MRTVGSEMARKPGRIPRGPASQKPEKHGRLQKDVKKTSLVTVVFPQVDLQGQKELLLTLAVRGSSHWEPATVLAGVAASASEAEGGGA